MGTVREVGAGRRGPAGGPLCDTRDMTDFLSRARGALMGLAAGVLASSGILLPPAAAAVLMSLSTIVVALNAQLLRRIDLDPAHLAPTSPKEEHTTPTPASTAVH